MVHFDTNFLIQAIAIDSPAHRKVREWSANEEPMNISSIVWAEFLCGPLDETSESIAKLIFPKPENFTAADSLLAAELFNKTGRRSRSLADCMIAAVAIRCGATLATFNSADFQPFASHGLVLV